VIASDIKRGDVVRIQGQKDPWVVAGVAECRNGLLRVTFRQGKRHWERQVNQSAKLSSLSWLIAWSNQWQYERDEAILAEVAAS